MMINFNNKLNLNNKTYDLILIDTSSILRIQFERLMQTLIPRLQISGVKLTIPNAVMREIRFFSNESSTRGNSARRALENINVLYKAGLLCFEGNPSSSESADSYIITRVMQCRNQFKKALVVTQDFTLAKDLLQLNSITSTTAPAVNAQRINHSGELENFDFSHPSTPKVKYNNVSNVLKRFGM